MRDHAATSPRVAVARRDDFARFVAYAATEELGVDITGRLRVELVHAFNQKSLEFMTIGFTAKFDAGNCNTAAGLFGRRQAELRAQSRLDLLRSIATAALVDDVAFGVDEE